MTSDRPKSSEFEPGLVVKILSWSPALLVAALLVAAPTLGWQLRDRAAPTSYVDKISVAATATPAVLGWKELGQHVGPRSAGQEHLLVTRNKNGWFIGNRSSTRRVLVRTDKIDSRYLQRWRLEDGDRITLPDAELAVVMAGRDRLVIADPDTGRQVTWDDGNLLPDGEAVHKVCRSVWSRAVQKARWIFRNIDGESRPEFPLFSIGGGVNCSERWKHSKLPPRGLTVMWHAGSFWLAPGGRRQDVLLQRKQGGRQQAFADLLLSLSGFEGKVQSIVLGRTQYLLEPSDKALDLIPVANVDLWFEETPAGSARKIGWVGDGAGPAAWLESQLWLMFPGDGAGLLAMGAVLWFWSRRRRLGVWWLLRSMLAVGPAMIGGWATVLLLRGGGDPSDLLTIGMVWLSWSWASLMLLLSGRLRGIGGWIWMLAVFLAAVGTLNMLQLGAGAENSRWTSFVLKHATILSTFGWTVSMMTVVTDRAWRRIWMWIFNTEGLAAGLAVILVLLMMVQLALGSEEGIGGIQPVEVTKTVFVVLLAFVGLHITEIRRRETRAYRRSPLFFLLPFLRFIGIFFVVVLSLVLGVRDFSPMIIISLVTLAWLWKAGGRQRGESTGAWFWLLLRPSVAAALIAMVAAGYWAYNNAEELPAGIPQKDRILVWSAPELYPHSGSQVLDAMDRVSEGGWTGAVEWFGPNEQVMKLPAVQDDFITAFFLYRFGGLAGLALLGAQILYLWGIFTLANRFQARTAEADFREQNAGLVLAFTLYGLGWMQIAHWTIAWSNTLGLLPVMGQPMTWLSAGNSHLLGFALFTLTIALVTSWVLRARD